MLGPAVAPILPKTWPTLESEILSDNYVNQPKTIRVIVLGAGLSGIAFTYKAKQLEGVSFTIYEKNSEIGGTWYESKYPGVSCDVPAHCYTYTWVGNPDWTSVYASGQELQAFFKKLALQYGVYDHTKFRHEITKAEWDNDAGLWRITVQDLDTGHSFIDSAEVFMNCGGVLNNWKWPDIQGLHSFGGQLAHTANWNDHLDLKDKTVAVIGAGASAIQLVPTIQPLVKKLVSFHRSPSWIAAEFAGQFAASGRSTVYTDEEKKRFREDPEYFRQYRRDIEHGMNARFPVFYKNSDAQVLGVVNVTKAMRARLNHDPKLCEKLIPTFELGCRSNGSLIPALEHQIDFALAFVKKIQTQDLRYVVVTEEATAEFNEWKDEFMKGMTWTGNCTSWYKNGTADGKVIGPWPGSVNHFLRALEHPRFEDFSYKHNSRNRFRYLGDGRAVNEAKGLPLGEYVK